MTSGEGSQIRTVTFGDLDEQLWGVAWSGASALTMIADANGATTRSGDEATFGGSSPSGDWTVSGADIELVVSPQSDPVEAGGFDQLCRVRGRAAVGGSERTIDCLALRGVRELAGLEVDSLREVGAFFAGEEAIALRALRPRRSAGHDSDLVVAELFEPEGVTRVEEPRLSTTYGAGGLPTKAGMELWLTSEDGESQFPRRVAGEAFGAGSGVEVDGFWFSAQGFRWHSRGRDGAGVYVLARRR